MGTHDGHRKRIRKRFIDHGLDVFEDHTVLELLLSFAIPRIDVNPLAHKLVNAFGSFSAVLDAPVSELVKVDGIGENAAVLIHLIPQLSRKYILEKASADNILCTTEQIGEYIMPLFHGCSKEQIFAVCLDNKYKVLGYRRIADGDINSSNFSTRKVVEYAVNINASKIILAHNHPSGIALPSVEDVSTSLKLQNTFNALNIELYDHIIVADDDFVSMRDNGSFSE